jgi:hypothetical protein
MMGKKRRLWVFAISGVLLLALMNHALNPLRWSNDNLRQWVLEKVPAGSDVDRLKSVANEHDWQVDTIWEGGKVPAWTEVESETVVRVHLGGYWALFQTEVGSYWIFDENGRLQDVRIERFADSP